MQKTAIVTGASRGIGAETARALAENGYNVVVNYLNSEKAARAVADEIVRGGGEAAVYRADVVKPAEAAALCAFAAEAYGRLDLLVNNAGVSLVALLGDTADAQYDRLFDTNMRGVFNMCRAAASYFLRRQSGAVVNVSSMWGQAGASCESVYAASKAAVIGFTKSLAKELAPSGVRVNCVAPGFIDTEMNAALGEAARAAVIEETPLGRAGTPRDVAEAVLYLARAEFVTGQVVGVNGGLVI